MPSVQIACAVISNTAAAAAELSELVEMRGVLRALLRHLASRVSVQPCDPPLVSLRVSVGAAARPSPFPAGSRAFLLDASWSSLPPSLPVTGRG